MAPPVGQLTRLPIDYFFRSLAEDQGARAIGVVLSGTGTDGTFGLKAIKEAGGITFAQDPETAKYDGMPRSAIESGFADFCLGTDRIAEELQNIGSHPYLARNRPSPAQAQESVGKLIVLMRGAFGNDLTYYKPSTIERRVERRMALHKFEKLEDYVKFVQGNADELKLLYKDMLIGVTSFFRDTDPFDALKSKVFAHILEHKEVGSPSASGCPPAPPARRPTPSPSACSSTWGTGRRTTACRSSAPTSTRRRSRTRAAASTRTTSPSTSRPSG
jgi:two-component system CheB/CheR fusion protein